MLEQILSLDQAVFLFINSDMSNGFFDVFLPFMRNQWVWFPLYALILLFFVVKYKFKGFMWVLWCIATVVLADFVSSQLIKKTVMRARPCHIMDELTTMVLRVNCGSGFSYTSSHATNHMALAVFIIITTAFCFKKWRWTFLPWALIIGFAQIYVGVHYPVDVISGFLLGAILGGVSGHFFQKTKWGQTAINPLKA